MTRREKRKLYNQKLKELNKAHVPEKGERRRHYNWKKSWGAFVRYDADWDGAYLLDLIIYKLERMYLSLDIYSDEVREDLDKRLKVLKETIDLGKKIQDYDYYEESHKFSREHTTHYVLVYKHTDLATVGKGKFKIQTWKNEELIQKIAEPKRTPEEQVNYMIESGDWFGLETGRKWAQDNGYDPKEVHFATCGEWDNEENHDTWLQMMDNEAKVHQKDKDKFFKSISKHYDEWWW